jgi:pimeloyl-ACP methyl ester carboxylesterase
LIARTLFVAVVTLAFTPLACGSTTLPASSTQASAPVEARVPSVDGVPIHYVVEGSGPTVVLLHCLGCNLHYWDVAAADLARDHRVVRLDYAGHGDSGSERKTWGIAGFVADIRAVLDAAGVDKFTLAGHSMSGPIGIEAAKQLGDRVTGIVPVDTLLDADERMPEDQRAATIAKVRMHYRDFVYEFLPHLMPKNPDPKVLARVTADALAKDPERTASILDWLLTYPAGKTLDGLGMPIVAIDSDLRPPVLDHNRAHAPQFDVRIIQGTGHFLMLDKPTEFASTLREVVESIESGKAKRRPT